MTIENLKDKLHDKIEIYVCEEEENTLIAQGMLKALGMMDEVLENAEQEPTDTWSIKDVADTLSKHGLIVEQEPCEECDYSEIVDWEQDAKTGKAKPIYWCERHKEPCDDAISRQAVLKTLDDMDNVLDEDRTVENYKELLKECYEVLPSVRQQEPKTGHWINKEYRKEEYILTGICSVCGRVSVIDEICHHCGAKMVETQESEDKK